MCNVRNGKLYLLLIFFLTEIKVALLLANFIGMHLLASEYLIEIQ